MAIDIHRFNRVFVGLLLTCFVVGFPAALNSKRMIRLAGEKNLRHRSISEIYWLRGSHSGNHREKLDQDCNIWPQAKHLEIICGLKQLEGTEIDRKNLQYFSSKRTDQDCNIWPQAKHLEIICGLKQLEGTEIDRKNLQYFSSKRTDVNSVKQKHNAGSLFEHNLAKTINNQLPLLNSFLHGSVYRHRRLASFVSSSSIPTDDDHGEFIRPVSGEDENLNLLLSLEQLRALLHFHTQEKRSLRSRSLGILAISPIAAVSPSPSGAQNNHYKAPAPSPENLSPQLGPLPSPGIVLPDQHSSILSPVPPPKQSIEAPPEQPSKKSGNSKAIILAVVITAISTLLLTGLFFYLYRRFFSDRHRSNQHNDIRPLLFSSIHSESQNCYYGESQEFNWATFENSNGISHKTAVSGTGKANGAQLSSFNKRNLRVLSLPPRLRKGTETIDIRHLPPLPKKTPSLELSDKDAFNSVCSPSISCSLDTSAPLISLHANSSAAPHSFNNDPTQPIKTRVSSSSDSQSTPSPLVSSKLSPSVPLPNPFAHPPPPPPPPPPISKSQPPPPPIYKSPPPPPGVPANGKSNLPKPPLLPARSSQLPPPLPPRPKAGQAVPPVAQSPFGSGGSLEKLNAVGEDGNLRPKLKPFHWDKVQANPDHSMVWDQIRSGSFQFNEEMIETLFGYNSTNTGTNRVAKQAAIPSSQNPQLLDPKKSQNLAIFLKALNLRREEVYDALLEGEGLSPELLETLIKMAPTRDEERKLKEYTGDISKLGPAERFLKALVEIPFAFERFDKMLYRLNFKEEISYITKSFETLEVASKELRSSRLFLKLLEAVLKTGNRMNVGTLRGGAQAFKLEALLKLSDVKGADGKTTLLHFVVQEIIRAEGIRASRVGQQSGSDATSNLVDAKSNSKDDGNMSSENKEDYYRKIGLQVLANLSNDLSNVRNAATIDSDALTSSVSKLVTGLNKLRSFLQREFASQPTGSSMQQGHFYQSMTLFLHEAEENISQIQSEEKRVFSNAKELTKYFHSDAAKEEAHPFRIFVIVRDFTGMLDQVCKEVGRMQKQNPPSSSQKGSSSISVQHVPRSLFPYAFDRNANNSDEDSISD